MPAPASVQPLAGDLPAAALEVGALGQLVLIALDGPPLGLVLQRLASIAARAIPGAAAVSITVVRARAASSTGFAGAAAAFLDERQYESGFGPCLRAAATGGEVVVGDTACCPTYPGYASLAAHHGVGSVVAIGLVAGGGATAALAIYRAEPAGGDRLAMAATIATARVFAAYGAVAVANAAAMDEERSTCSHLAAATANRAGIEQAKGVLMAQRAITAQQAFAALAATSQHTNVKLAQVAAVVATASGQNPMRP